MDALRILEVVATFQLDSLIAVMHTTKIECAPAARDDSYTPVSSVHVQQMQPV